MESGGDRAALAAVLRKDAREATSALDEPVAGRGVPAVSQIRPAQAAAENTARPPQRRLRQLELHLRDERRAARESGQRLPPHRAGDEVQQPAAETGRAAGRERGGKEREKA